MNASSGGSSSLAAVEYQSLYAEIADTSRRMAGVIQICVIGFISVMTLSFSAKDIFSAKDVETILPRMALPALFLLPSFIILMCFAHIRSLFVTIVRTGTYILVFYERHEPSISWQARIQQLRLEDAKSRALIKSLWYVFIRPFLLSLFTSVLSLSVVSDWKTMAFWENNIVAIVCYAVAYVYLPWVFYKLMQDLLYVWDTPYFKEMIGRWMKLKKAETNEALKERLTFHLDRPPLRRWR